MTDRELIELAAKSVGIRGCWDDDSNVYLSINEKMKTIGDFWNPLANDGDALRLAVKLGIDISDAQIENNCFSNDCVDQYAATRRAIVSVAAEIGKGMK